MNNPKQNRGRHRNNGRRSNPSRQNFDSNGPGVRIRGNATQVYEKYIQLARDAQGSGDRVMAENMLQHAEHYYRILNENAPDRNQRPQSQDSQDSQNSGNGAQQSARDDQADADVEDVTQDNSVASPEGDSAEAAENTGRGRGRRNSRSNGGGSNGRSNGRGRRSEKSDAPEEVAAAPEQSELPDFLTSGS